MSYIFVILFITFVNLEMFWLSKILEITYNLEWREYKPTFLILLTFSIAFNIDQPVRFARLLWLKVLFAGLLWEKNTAGWLLIPLNQRNEQGG
jgi:hypothetical protein